MKANDARGISASTFKDARLFRGLTAGFLAVAFFPLTGCGPSPVELRESAYAEGYEEGMEAGQESGKQEALDCVRGEGGGAEDAADTCE